MSQTARTDRMLGHAKLALIDAAFHEGPTFAMGYDHHVRAWYKFVQRRVWVLYHTEREFQTAYDERRAA